jgi:hypothetical protein
MPNRGAVNLPALAKRDKVIPAHFFPQQFDSAPLAVALVASEVPCGADEKPLHDPVAALLAYPRGELVSGGFRWILVDYGGFTVRCKVKLALRCHGAPSFSLVSTVGIRLIAYFFRVV